MVHRISCFGKDIIIVNWIIVFTLAFEVVYIGIQASKGQASHYNQSNLTYAGLYVLMAIAASIDTLAVGYIGIKFWAGSILPLPGYYLWALKLGFLLFVIFSFEGFAMGARLAHSVGGSDGSPGIRFLNWSFTVGDLRIAHFIGMHALQVLPLLSWYLLKDSKLVLIIAIFYSFLAFFVLAQALRGISVFKLFV